MIVTPGQLVIDCVTSPPSTVLKANRVVALSRYLAKLPNPKVITPAERDRLLNDGFGLLLNWEQSATDPL
ncbi:hypothetical protein GM527_13750, partial [Streptococcus pneumoniae]|uniref:hypothetical protein n=1 Tax=Streptococcus pneumoniae TaxID=1313 RepID=UPI0012D835BA